MMKRVARVLRRRPADTVVFLLLAALILSAVAYLLVAVSTPDVGDRTALHAVQALCWDQVVDEAVKGCKPALVDRSALADGAEVYVYRVEYTTTRGTTADAPGGVERLGVAAVAVTINPDGTVREVQ